MALRPIEMLQNIVATSTDPAIRENAQKELTFLFEEIESSFPLDEWDEDDDLNVILFKLVICRQVNKSSARIVHGDVISGCKLI